MAVIALAVPGRRIGEIAGRSGYSLLIWAEETDVEFQSPHLHQRDMPVGEFSPLRHA